MNKTESRYYIQNWNKNFAMRTKDLRRNINVESEFNGTPFLINRTFLPHVCGVVNIRQKPPSKNTTIIGHSSSPYLFSYGFDENEFVDEKYETGNAVIFLILINSIVIQF